jgi:predicted nucleic acid-binding Zn ribbon protein
MYPDVWTTADHAVSTWQPSGSSPSEREPKKLSELLDRTAKRLGGPSTGTSSTVFSRWEEVVGADIAGHARPVSLHGGTLLLAVDHPAWATELRYMTSDLLTRISEATGRSEVTEIHIRVAGDQTRRTSGASDRRARKDRG